MSTNSIDMNFIKELKADLKKYSHTVSSNLAHTVANELQVEYEYLIEAFYNEYTPEYYVRHADRGMQSGLSKTFKRHYKNAHNTVYYGGIEITSEKMYSDYHDSSDMVLDSFLNGYHGRPSMGIESGTEVFRHMLKYRDFLSTHIDDFIPDAVKQANKLSYSVLKF